MRYRELMFSVGIFILTLTTLGFSEEHEGGSGVRRPGSAGFHSTGPCEVDSGALADFANGSKYEFKQLVNYLTLPSCETVAKEVSLSAVGAGISFSNEAPYRLDYFAKPLLEKNEAGWKQNGAQLEQSIGKFFREKPLPREKLLPVVGQLAVLSIPAARQGMAELIKRDLAQLEGSRLGDQKPNPSALASSLESWGANREPIAKAFAGVVEEMAILAQADSLSRIFESLGLVVQVDGSFVPTFNLSVDALKNGVGKGLSVYSNDQKEGLTKVTWSALSAILANEESVEQSKEKVNETFGNLLAENPIHKTALKGLWSEILRVLAQDKSQMALAETVALSLTPEVIYLPESERVAMLGAAGNYETVALSIQNNFLKGWARNEKAQKNKQMGSERANFLKEHFFSPWTQALLPLDPTQIDPAWLILVSRNDLVSDESMEKYFPQHVLYYLQRMDRGTERSLASVSLDGWVENLASQFASTWILSSVHMLSLQKWLKRHPNE